MNVAFANHYNFVKHQNPLEALALVNLRINGTWNADREKIVPYRAALLLPYIFDTLSGNYSATTANNYLIERFFKENGVRISEILKIADDIKFALNLE